MKDLSYSLISAGGEWGFEIYPIDTGKNVASGYGFSSEKNAESAALGKIWSRAERGSYIVGY